MEPTPPPEENEASKTDAPPITTSNTNASEAIATTVAGETKTDDAARAIHKIVDALLSAKSAAEKHELFEQLIKSGQLDQAIAELKQREADNPNDPEIPTTIGEAQLNEIKALHDSGADTDQMGILAMQADQNFNAALKIDPSNWEAQYVKDASMYYWPADPTRDNNVIQSLASLIDQQENLPAQPQFAQTYLLLGNEYQKMGQPDKALATWQLGAQKFPNDPTLQQKIGGQ
jgi:tetratricopeptide (TPR) repeat protein